MPTKIQDRQEREPIDDLTDKVTYYGDNGQGEEIVVCVGFEPNEAEQAKFAVELAEEKAKRDKADAGVVVLEQHAAPGKNPPAEEVTKSLVEVVLALEARVAKLEGSG